MPIVVRSNTKKYIEFDDNGRILSIKNTPSSDQYITVDSFEVQDLLKGIIPSNEYTVEYDLVAKDYVLKHSTYWTEARSSDSFLYKIENDNEPDLTIVQDNVQKKWQIKLSEQLIKTIEEKNVNLDHMISNFSVTKKNNPYYLYCMLNFKKDTFTIDFQDNFKFDKEPVSVYTVKKFGSYAHEVIND